MTKSEAVSLLFDYDLALYNARMGDSKSIFLRGAPQIIALIEQQAATIEAQTEAVLQESAMRQRAEARCAAMRNCIKRLIYVIDSTPECFRAIDKTTEYLLAQDFADDVKTTAGAAILAQNKRMREALERIAACLNQSEHNAIIALQIAEQWEQMGEKA